MLLSLRFLLTRLRPPLQDRIRLGVAADLLPEELTSDEPPELVHNSFPREAEAANLFCAAPAPLKIQKPTHSTLQPPLGETTPAPRTLLRKLLDKEIRCERSHLLQAFRHLENSGHLAEPTAS